MTTDSTQPRIIAIETSCRTGSVALAVGPDVVEGVVFGATLNHGVELLPTIDELTRRQGWAPDSISQLYVSAGPGSFTGLRIGITLARTLAMSIGAKIVAVPTVDVIAANALAADTPPDHLAVVLDAKRDQVYAALFDRRTATAAEAPGTHAQRPPGIQTSAEPEYVRTMNACVIAPADLLAKAPRPLAVLGEGVPYHRDALTAQGVALLPEELARPKAETVHRIGWRSAKRGEFTAPRTLIPIYLRRPEAEEVWQRRHGHGQRRPVDA